MRNSLSPFEGSSVESTAEERRVNPYGSLVAENEASMGEDEIDVAEVCKFILL